MEIGFVLDTSAYSEYERKNLKVAKYMNSGKIMYMPVIVLGELRGGFLNGSKPLKNEDILNDFLNMPNVTVLKITEKTTEIYAKIYASLRKASTPVGTNDMWIASICIENKLPLLTLDADFSKIPGLKILEL
jgi:predicted nucleic acid-binding protein